MNLLTGLKTIQRQFPIGHLMVNLSTVADAEDLLDEMIAHNPDDELLQEAAIPYWAELWHSALGMSYWMVKNQDRIVGKKVIEIGCGIGLPGIVASLLGAKVVFTDYLQPALDFARYNLEQNQSPHQARFELLDWRNPPLDQSYDIVLAADVAYEKDLFLPLYNCIKQLVGEQGVCWLSEPGRMISKEFLNNFTNSGFQQLFLTNEVAMLDGVERQINIRGIKRQ